MHVLYILKTLKVLKKIKQLLNIEIKQKNPYPYILFLKDKLNDANFSYKQFKFNQISFDNLSWGLGY